MICRRTLLSQALLALPVAGLLIPAATKAAGSDPAAVLWETLAVANLDEAGDVDPEDVAALLTAAGPQAALAFEIGFSEAMRRAYRWDLWGAGYVIHGGMSDDGFAYFRAWVIAQGQEVFEQVLADPDSLADLIPAGRQAPLELEALLYAGATAWEAATGKSPSGQEWQSGDMTGADPAGQPFDEDRLGELYPKLSARFDRAPLG